MNVQIRVKYLSEKLYALRRLGPGGCEELCYRLGTSITEVWDAVVEEEIFGTGWTKRLLEAEGWKAVEVRVVQESRR